MACNHSSALFLTALLLLTATNALAQLTAVRGITVNGTLCCTPTGTCPGGTPLSGAPVSLVCNILGIPVTIGNTTTGVNGSFTITNVSTLVGSLLNQINNPPCVGVVRLPLSQALCPVLSAVNGTLVGILQPTGSLISQVLGLLRALTVAFSIVV